MTQLDLVDGMVRGSRFLERLAGRSATVVGLAREALVAARLLHAAGARVRVEPVATRADLTGEAAVVVAVAAGLMTRAVAAARAAGVPVLGDLDLAWCATEADAFAVTGGSSDAATRLAKALLNGFGRSVMTLGDDDMSPLARDGSFAADGVLLVEPSVAQLAAVQVFRPRVAVLLRGAEPLAVRLMSHQTARDCLVLAADDPSAGTLARMARARVVWLSTTRALDHGVYVARGRIAARLNGYVEEICPIRGIPPARIEAALAAVACALWAGLDPDAIGQALLRCFALERTESHRLLRPAAFGTVSSGVAAT